LIYINDAPDNLVDVFMRLFADDNKIFRPLDGAFACRTIQHNLCNFNEFCCLWQIGINGKKSVVIHIGKDNPLFTYSLDGVEIVGKPSERDLGVILDSDLTFSTHIASIVKSAYLRVNLILTCFNSRNVQFLSSMLSIYVRPLLEYASPVWSPYLLKDIAAIENVQRSFTRRIYGFGALSYSERLIACSLEPLEVRRIKADLLLTHKILHNLVEIYPDNFFTLLLCC